MKRKTLGLVHTSAALVPIFAQLCNEKLPDVDTFNIVDDSMVRALTAGGGMTPDIAGRVAGYIASAKASGADFVLVTCSSIGPAVEAAAPSAGVPVLRVDQPMADLAVQTGRRVGVLATLPTTLGPTTDLVCRRALALQRTVVVTSRLCEGAFAALSSGDAAQHDVLLSAAVLSLAEEVDVIVLAQASMARVLEVPSLANLRVPVFASPALGIDHVAGLMRNL